MNLAGVSQATKQFIDWFQSHNGPTIHRSDLESLFHSRRRAHSVLLETEKLGLITAINAHQFLATAELSALRSGDHKPAKTGRRRRPSQGNVNGDVVTGSESQLKDLRLTRLKERGFLETDSKLVDKQFLETQTDSQQFLETTRSYEVHRLRSSLLAHTRSKYINNTNNKYNINNTNSARTRSNSSAKTHESKQDKAKAKAKAIAKARSQGKQLSVNLGEQLSNAKAFAMGKAFETALRAYHANPRLNFKRYEHKELVRAAHNADAIGMDYAVYIRAQFVFFDRSFARAPKVHQLGSQKAIQRAREYVALRKAEKVSDRDVRGRVRKAPTVTENARFKHCENQLQILMRNYGATEEEILRTFATAENAKLYFDRGWLRQNSTYQRLKSAGEL